MFIVPISQMSPVTLEKTTSVETGVGAESSVPFADVLASAIEATKETMAVAQQDSYRLAMGEMDDLHTMMINSTKATAALELTVEVTSRAVSAYNEILRMQV